MLAEVQEVVQLGLKSIEKFPVIEHCPNSLLLFFFFLSVSYRTVLNHFSLLTLKTGFHQVNFGLVGEEVNG